MGKYLKEYYSLSAVRDYLTTKEKDGIEVLYVDEEIRDTALRLREISVQAVREWKEKQLNKKEE